MAASAYAFVVSLMNTMDSIEIHPRLRSACFNNDQFESLRKNLDSLLDFVEHHSDDSVMDAESSEAEDLLSRIAVVVQLTEDLIEVEAADQVRDLSTTAKSQSFSLDLQRKIQEMDSIINEEVVIKVKEERPFQDDHQFTPAAPVVPPSSSAPPPATIKKSAMVGFDGYVEQLLDELTGHHSGRRILPIVGMGGVGKTTLARNVYQNRLTVEHFTVRVWITVSQTFNVSDIFLQALSCLGESTGEKDGTTDYELGEKLHKTLFLRRYLIVLDDMWDVEVWERIKFYFPENNNGSRIVVTTRQQQLVDYFASSSVAVDFLDNKNSWELFCDKIFGEGGCPPELQQVGEKIVRRCKGLPLAITVIGGLLRNSPRTQEYWEKIAKDKSLALEYSSGSDEEGKNPLSILYTSYKHLPVCLKSCFLYLGLFPEDDRIKVSKLIKFWIAEGFVKPNRKQSLEEVAESCIKELVDRNLLLVGDFTLQKKIRFYYVHDIVRELMIRIAEKENFYCVQRDIGGTCEFIVDERTASFYPPESLRFSVLPISVYHPLKFRGQNGAPFKSRLQRVMVHPMDALCEEVNLRLIYDLSYGSLYESATLSSSTLPLFWSLQNIIVRSGGVVDVPVEIWKMQQLRHIEIEEMLLPDPPTSTGEDVIVLHNLQTLGTPRNLRWSEEVCKRIPNVKELRLEYDLHEKKDANLCLDLHKLNKLELLVLECNSYIEDALQNLKLQNLKLQNLKLPNSLKELTLYHCGLAWSDLEMFALLPHLQILELYSNAMVGAEWNMGVEVEFLSLKHLVIQANGCLITWIADASNFPVLETLELFWLENLEEIPPGIGEIPTIEKIRVYGCSRSSAMSAIKILEEQLSLGNEDLHIQLEFRSEGEVQWWMENLHIQNLHISRRPV